MMDAYPVEPYVLAVDEKALAGIELQRADSKEALVNIQHLVSHRQSGYCDVEIRRLLWRRTPELWMSHNCFPFRGHAGTRRNRPLPRCDACHRRTSLATLRQQGIDLG